jgi:hypothetical protein
MHGFGWYSASSAFRGDYRELDRLLGGKEFHTRGSVKGGAFIAGPARVDGYLDEREMRLDAVAQDRPKLVEAQCCVAAASRLNGRASRDDHEERRLARVSRDIDPIRGG